MTKSEALELMYDKLIHKAGTNEFNAVHILYTMDPKSAIQLLEDWMCDYTVQEMKDAMAKLLPLSVIEEEIEESLEDMTDSNLVALYKSIFGTDYAVKTATKSCCVATSTCGVGMENVSPARKRVLEQAFKGSVCNK